MIKNLFSTIYYYTNLFIKIANIFFINILIHSSVINNIYADDLDKLLSIQPMYTPIESADQKLYTIINPARNILKCTIFDKPHYAQHIKPITQINLFNNLSINKSQKSNRVIQATSWKIKHSNIVTLPSDIAIYDQDDKPYYFDQFEDRTLLVVFWATWSTNCLNDLIGLNILQKDFRKLPFQIILVSIDYQKHIVQNFLVQNNIKFLTSYYDKNNQLFQSLNVVGIPTVFLITTDNEIVGNMPGSLNWHSNELREFIFSHIKTDMIIPKNTSKDSFDYLLRDIDKEIKTTKTIEKSIEQKNDDSKTDLDEVTNKNIKVNQQNRK